MQKHFLFVTMYGGGSVPPELGLARRVMARGQRVSIIGDDCIATEIKSTGAAFIPYTTAPNCPEKKIQTTEVMQDWKYSNPAKGIELMMEKIMCGPALEYAQDIMAVHGQDPVDTLVVSGFVLGGIIAGEKLGLPTYVMIPNIDMRPVAGRVPAGPGFKPMGGMLGQIRDALLRKVNQVMFAKGIKGLDRARAELGLDTGVHPFALYDRADAVLLLTSQAFEYPYPPTPKTHFVGPILDEPQWADRQFQFKKTSEKPLVLVTLGSTFQNQKALYQRVIDALGKLEVQAIVTLGNVFETSVFNTPENVQICQSAPHGPILAQADAAVVHCGHGSVMKALVAGVPTLCLPLGRDQMDNATRVAWHGAGIQLKAKADVQKLQAGIFELIQNPKYRTQAQALGAKIKADIDQNLATEILDPGPFPQLSRQSK